MQLFWPARKTRGIHSVILGQRGKERKKREEKSEKCTESRETQNYSYIFAHLLLTSV